jgi:hypothetical protein
MIGAKMMIRNWCGRLLAAHAVSIAVAVVVTPHPVSARDFHFAAHLMALRGMKSGSCGQG